MSDIAARDPLPQSRPSDYKRAGPTERLPWTRHFSRLSVFFILMIALLLTSTPLYSGNSKSRFKDLGKVAIVFSAVLWCLKLYLHTLHHQQHDPVVFYFVLVLQAFNGCFWLLLFLVEAHDCTGLVGQWLTGYFLFMGLMVVWIPLYWSVMDYLQAKLRAVNSQLAAQAGRHQKED